jgi:hypothetical protein
MVLANSLVKIDISNDRAPLQESGIYFNLIMANWENPGSLQQKIFKCIFNSSQAWI